MKHLLYLTFCILVCGCTKPNNVQSAQTPDTTVQPTPNNSESEPIDVLTASEPEPNAYRESDINIFYLGSVTLEGGQEQPFVNLSELYPYDEARDTFVVSDDYLYTENPPDAPYQLTAVQRRLFLRRSGVAETDNVYVHDYEAGKTYTLPVASLSVSAHLTPYGLQSEAEEFDYQYGLNLDGLPKSNTLYRSGYVMIGPQNPFAAEALQPLVWSEIDTAASTSVNLRETRYGSTKDLQWTTAYSASSTDYTLYLNDYRRDNYSVSTRQLVVTDKRGTVVYDTHFSEGESTSFAPLQIAGQPNQYGPHQFTGRLFADRAPVVFGFTYESFDCPSIQIIDRSEAEVRVRCDNRH